MAGARNSEGRVGGGSWWHKFPMEHSARRIMFETENAGINAVAEDVEWVEGRKLA